MSSPTPTNPDAEKLKNILIPAAAVGALIVLAGLIYGLKNAEPGSAAPGVGGPLPVTPGSADAADMSTVLPPLDSPEWKNQGGGLKTWDVKEGTGEAVKPGQSVTCHYIGWTTDGKSFDGSVARGEPSTFSLNGVIAGWTQGLPGMKPGGIRRLYIPWDLAYGAAGKPPTIPPKADLVFEVKMFSSR